MKGLVYLVRKGDLYAIGHAKNIEDINKRIKPDQIIETLYLEDPQNLEARLFRRYKKNRLPESAYFSLTNSQVVDCKKQLGTRSQIPKSLAAEFSISFTGSILIFILVFLISNYFKLGFLLELSISLAIGSLPFWLLLILGNFGGYETSDLPLFSSWANRTKALSLAALITALAYLLLSLSFRY
ncbi:MULTISPECIES: GIY-YIG nuclease family protein [Prochlorococcus]|uniref:GIY-YIG nuclease family protein n=1 Tax=Prochlorococcus TaxID=1218 RepID=UPI000533A29D|nr:MULTISPECIES: GIY-YIG nuclease family protein [Prochlorococcus]KGG12600.1 putative NADH-ubiquinone/plastoquinone [Prochlorococcus sp. MIT 0601]